MGLNVVAVLLAEDWQVPALYRSNADVAALDRLRIARAVGDVSNSVAVEYAVPPDVTPEVNARICVYPAGDTDKTERELGHRPVPFVARIKDSSRWLRKLDPL